MTDDAQSAEDGTEARPVGPHAAASLGELAQTRRARRKRRWMAWSQAGLEETIRYAYARGYADGQEDTGKGGAHDTTTTHADGQDAGTGRERKADRHRGKSRQARQRQRSAAGSKAKRYES